MGATLQEKLRRTAREMAPIAISAPEAPSAPKRTLPAYNGFGSFEDSAQNCTSLLPQPPKKNFYSLMQVTRSSLTEAPLASRDYLGVAADEAVRGFIPNPKQPSCEPRYMRDIF